MKIVDRKSITDNCWKDKSIKIKEDKFNMDDIERLAMDKFIKDREKAMFGGFDLYQPKEDLFELL